MTSSELASRASISVATLRKIERGDPSPSIGLVFEVAAIAGVPLYGAAPTELLDLSIRAVDRLSLLPQRVRHRADEVIDDNF